MTLKFISDAKFFFLFFIRFLFPPEAEKKYNTKIHFWARNLFSMKPIFLLRQEDDRCTGIRIGLCHELFLFLFPPEVEKKNNIKIL